MDVLEHHDVQVDILGRLPACSLAVCRRVCTAWRATVDAHGLLRAAGPQGIIYETTESVTPMFFSRPSMARHIVGTFRSLVETLPLPQLMDCCNGLLLLWNHVLNPATGQIAQLPPRPPSCEIEITDSECYCTVNHYLLYDPAVSPHYEVLLVPAIPNQLPSGHISRNMSPLYAAVFGMDWPPSAFIMNVFSSKTGSWDERSFVRQGEAAGAVFRVKSPTYESYLYHTAYWQGQLYVRCEYGFVLRINPQNDTYRVIKFPKGKSPRLGKSKDGVYCTLRHRRSMFEIYFLEESPGDVKWVLKNKINLEPVKLYYDTNYTDEPWIVESCDPEETEWMNDTCLESMEDSFEWNSDDENAIDTTQWPSECSNEAPFFNCLGFHPYKEIVFFDGCGRTLAYNFKSSKIRHLGSCMKHDSDADMDESFLYAPCWMRNLPGSSK